MENPSRCPKNIENILSSSKTTMQAKKRRQKFPAVKSGVCRTNSQKATNKNMTRIQIDGENLTLDQLYSIALGGAEVELSQPARERMNASRAVVERLIESNAAVYGVNTGL